MLGKSTPESAKPGTGSIKLLDQLSGLELILLSAELKKSLMP
jgi:hypothetical protein